MRQGSLRRKSEPRMDTRYLQSLKIQAAGEGNTYYQDVHDIIQASSSGCECVERFAEFIEGAGFADTSLYNLVLNHRRDTADEIHRLVCSDLAEYGGFALHLNYNLAGQITEIQHVPFEICRLEEPDSNGYVAHICTHPDWTGKRTFAGKRKDIDKKNVKLFHKYNPNINVIHAQIAAVGGIENYNGQIFYFSSAGKDRYPIPRADRVLTDMSTDEGLSNVKWRNVRNNFLPAAMIFTRKGQSAPMSRYAPAGEIQEYRPLERGERYLSDSFSDGFTDSLQKLQGDTEACKLLEVILENDEQAPEVVQLPTSNYDKDFNVTEQSVTERIYAAFGQEPWYCIRSGKIGFSGTLLVDAFSYYNSVVYKYQRMIERAFVDIMKHWHEGAITNCAVLPLEYKQAETTENV